MRIYSAIACTALAAMTAACNNQPTAEETIARGKYLVSIAGCTDCHTPGNFTGMPDASKALSGSDVAFFLPGMGYFYPPNLTNDMTGLAQWTPAQIVTALRTGVRPDGRKLAPIMPWMNLANLTDQDANAIAAYLKSLPGIMHQVPPPAGPDAMPPGPTMAVVTPPNMTPVGYTPPPPPAPPPPPPAPARGGRGARGTAPGR